MKIGILTNSYPPNLNGVSVAVANLEKALVALGHEIFIVTPEVPNAIYADNVLALKSYSAPKHASSDLRMPYDFVKDTVQFLKKNQVQILHSQDTLFGGVEAVIIAMKLGIPCVHTYHTMVEDYDYFKFPGYRIFIRNYSQIVCDAHNAVVAVSSKTENYLRQIGVEALIIQIPNVLIPPKNGQNWQNKTEAKNENNIETKNLISEKVENWQSLANSKNLNYLQNLECLKSTQNWQNLNSKKNSDLKIKFGKKNLKAEQKLQTEKWEKFKTLFAKEKTDKTEKEKLEKWLGIKSEINWRDLVFGKFGFLENGNPKNRFDLFKNWQENSKNSVEKSQNEIQNLESLETLAKLSLDKKLEKTFNFLTFGRIAKEKSLDLGIEVLAPILKKYPNTRYIIAGNGPEMANLQSQILTANLENQVFLIGKYKSADLEIICGFCQVFVNTSSSENLPTTDFEALSFGLPIVAIDDEAHQFFVNSCNLETWEKTEREKTEKIALESQLEILEVENLISKNSNQINSQNSFQSNYHSNTQDNSQSQIKPELQIDSKTDIKTAQKLEQKNSWQNSIEKMDEKNSVLSSEDNLENGFYSPLEKMTEVCEKLYLEKNLLEKLSKNAAKTAQKLANRPVELEYLELYQNLIDEQNNEQKAEINQKNSQNKSKPIFTKLTKMNKSLDNYWQKWQSQFKEEWRDFLGK